MGATWLAELIETRRPLIVAAWLDRILSPPNSSYRNLPRTEVSTWLEAGVDALVNSLAEGSESSLQAHAQSIATQRLRSGFGIDEVVDALLQLKEVILEILAREDPDSMARLLPVSTIDTTVRSLVGRFTDHFARAEREQERQLSILAERQRLARDLHDSVSQSLYAVTLHATAARRHLNAGDLDGANTNLQQLDLVGRHALADMRLLVFELQPSTLASEGLQSALRLRLGAVEARSDLTVDLSMEPIPALGAEKEKALYGIACEALNNVLKHAHATRVSVSVRAVDDTVELRISDDGEGIPDNVPSGGFGMIGMAKRAAEVGGRLDVEDSSPCGTTVRARVPKGGPRPSR